MEHVAVYDEMTDTMILWGGDATNTKLYTLSFQTLKWSVIIARYSPTARYGSSAELYKRKMFLYGGYNNNYFSDMFSYCILSQTWHKYENLIGKGPGKRYLHCSALLDNFMYILGGRSCLRETNVDRKLHKIDLISLIWSEYDVENIGSDVIYSGSLNIVIDNNFNATMV